MPIVSDKDLNDYLSEPEWSEGQKRVARSLPGGLESQLESKLFGAYISLRDAITEVAAISPRGVVMTEQPVGQVISVDGTAITDTNGTAAGVDSIPTRVLTGGYDVRDGYLRVKPTSASSWPGYDTRPPLGAVTVVYRPGWGAVPALKQAILEKAATIMQNYHDDTLIAREADATRLPQLPPRTWTADEVAALGIFRNLFLVM